MQANEAVSNSKAAGTLKKYEQHMNNFKLFFKNLGGKLNRNKYTQYIHSGKIDIVPDQCLKDFIFPL